MKLDSGGVVADFLDRFLDVDDFAVNIEAEFLESFCNLYVVDRTEDSAGCACLGADCKLDILELCCELFGIGFDFGEFVSALTLVFGEYFECRFGGDNSLTGGNEVVAAVAVFTSTTSSL